jgi:hypothetical protein
MESRRLSQVTWSHEVDKHERDKEDEDDEIFTGEITLKELQRHKKIKKKIEKNRRKTVLMRPTPSCDSDEENAKESDVQGTIGKEDEVVEVPSTSTLPIDVEEDKLVGAVYIDVAEQYPVVQIASKQEDTQEEISISKEESNKFIDPFVTGT